MTISFHSLEPVPQGSKWREVTENLTRGSSIIVTEKSNVISVRRHAKNLGRSITVKRLPNGHFQIFRRT